MHVTKYRHIEGKTGTINPGRIEYIKDCIGNVPALHTVYVSIRGNTWEPTGNVKLTSTKARNVLNFLHSSKLLHTYSNIFVIKDNNRWNKITMAMVWQIFVKIQGPKLWVHEYFRSIAMCLLPRNYENYIGHFAFLLL